MKASLNWLRALVGKPFDATEAFQRLTLAGVEVESRVPFASIAGVVVAEVLATAPHPGSAKLTLVDVSDGRTRARVVCGASNVPAPGGLVVWAPPGATLPSGRMAEKEVRGVVSPGMLCAEDELGIGSSHEGILVLTAADGLQPGDDFAAKLGLPDEVWEVNVAANRPDLLGHVGVARELAALYRVPFTPPPAPADLGDGARAPVSVEDGEGCPRYSAVLVDGVAIAPSPLWVRLRLAALDVRPISNVVDATNLVMLESGQPLHAFDRDRLAGGAIVVRRARPGEELETLDGQPRSLGPDDVVICDRERSVAIGGVMGGAMSEVANSTTRLLIESACFDPRRVRRTAKRLGLHTEASHRFERGVDPAGAAAVARRVAGLIVELAGGRVAGPVTDVYPAPVAPRALTLRPARTSALLGVAIDADTQAGLLHALGLEARADGERLAVTVPTFRRDLEREIDLVEEVARHYGYDRVPPTLPRLDAAPGELKRADERRADAARDALAGLGLDEIVTFGFVSPAAIAALGLNERRARPLKLVNPMREEQSVMRTSLAAGTLAALQTNLARGQSDLGLFELGAVFLPGAGGADDARARHGGVRPGDRLPEERWHVAGVLHGRHEGWLKAGAPYDVFDVKGVVEELLLALGHASTSAAPAEPIAWLHPGVQAEVTVAGRVVGAFGEVHPRVCKQLGVEGRPFVFEVDLDALPAASAPRAVELPRFPAVTRDLSFFVDAAVSAASIRAAVERLRDPLLVEVRVLEDYRELGKVPAGKKGMLWSFTYRAPDRTLTDAAVQERHDALVAALAAELHFDRR